MAITHKTIRTTKNIDLLYELVDRALCFKYHDRYYKIIWNIVNNKNTPKKLLKKISSSSYGYMVANSKFTSVELLEQMYWDPHYRDVRHLVIRNPNCPEYLIIHNKARCFVNILIGYVKYL